MADKEELSVEEQIAKAIAEATELHKKELAGLNRKNSELQETLAKREKEGLSIEERISAIEADKEAAVRRANTVEAYAKAGLSDEWRETLKISDPSEQAEALKNLIAGVKAQASEELAKEFNVDPQKHLDGSKRTFTAAELKGKSPEEINSLWQDGRIAGVQ